MYHAVFTFRFNLDSKSLCCNNVSNNTFGKNFKENRIWKRNTNNKQKTQIVYFQARNKSEMEKWAKCMANVAVTVISTSTQ